VSHFYLVCVVVFVFLFYVFCVVFLLILLSVTIICSCLSFCLLNMFGRINMFMCVGGSNELELSHGGSTGELYGRLICDFVALNVNEVDASEGETVTVLQHIDSDWLEVRHDNGKVGLCPTSFVELFGAEPEPTIKPDMRPSKPKLPVKPKSLTTTKNRGVQSSAGVDHSMKSPVSSDLPVLNTQPVIMQPDNNTFLPTTDNVRSSPTTEAAKSTITITTTMTNSMSTTSRQPVSYDLSLDELIQAQLLSAKSGFSMAAESGRDIKPIEQRVPPDLAPTLNGVADVAGQSTWYRFTEEAEQVNTPVAVSRKPPPPPRPAPSRPQHTSAAPASAVASKNGFDGQRRTTTHLINFSPEHNQG